MTSLKNLCLGVALLVLGSTSVWASPVNGSFGFNASNLTFTPSIGELTYPNYSGTASFIPTLTTSSGDFGDHAAEYTGVSTLSLTLDGTNQTGYSQSVNWDFDGFGNFTGVVTVDGYGVLNNFITVEFVGTFTPTFNGHEASNASMSLSFIRSKTGTSPASHSASGTVSAAGTTIPEPATVALAAFGALALGIVARRRA